jgi:hypothetical protein
MEFESALGRIRGKLAEEEPDPSMAAALPPGAWWAAHNAPGQTEPYGPHAGDAAIDAARRGDLQLVNVDFSYPLRPEAPGRGETISSVESSWIIVMSKCHFAWDLVMWFIAMDCFGELWYLATIYSGLKTKKNECPHIVGSKPALDLLKVSRLAVGRCVSRFCSSFTCNAHLSVCAVSAKPREHLLTW